MHTAKAMGLNSEQAINTPLVLIEKGFIKIFFGKKYIVIPLGTFNIDREGQRRSIFLDLPLGGYGVRRYAGKDYCSLRIRRTRLVKLRPLLLPSPESKLTPHTKSLLRA